MHERVTVASIAERLRGTFPGDLGVEPVEVSDREVRGRLAVERRHLHPGGQAHGGVWVTLADTVAAWGTIRHLRPGQVHTTVEMKVNIVGAADEGDELVATATPVHLGRRTQVWEVHVENGGRPGALFVCTQIVLEPAAERG